MLLEVPRILPRVRRVPRVPPLSGFDVEVIGEWIQKKYSLNPEFIIDVEQGDAQHQDDQNRVTVFLSEKPVEVVVALSYEAFRKLYKDEVNE